MINKILQLKEIAKNRFVIFFSFVSVFVFINYYFTGKLLPSTEIKSIWFYSGLFMVIFSILFIEPYYASPKNVITNAIPLLLVFLAIKDSFVTSKIWWPAIIVLSTLIVASVMSISMEDKNKSPNHWKNILAEYLKKWVVFVGQGKVLYSAVFIFTLLTYFTIQSFYTLILFVLWFFVVSINPKRIKNTFATSRKEYNKNALGEIFGVQAKKIFLVKLFEDRKSIIKFDTVKFRYSMQDTNDLIIKGIVFDTYLLNQEKWMKVLQLGNPQKTESRSEKNVVYKITDKEEKAKLSEELNINNFVGIVVEGSNIGKLKFEYSGKQDNLQEGDLLELETREKKLFYQVINGSTEKEKLENRNEMGFVSGVATQLGEWRNEELSFQKFGWVPPINTPIFKADTSDKKILPYEYPEYKLGIIPGMMLPSVINLHEAVSHHMALLGVTGSGKSFITREIIKRIQSDTKIICVDFTGEWKKEFDSEKIEDFDNIVTAMANDKISVIELNDVSNTTESLKETNEKLQEIFTYAKENKNRKKICLVLEEAHTIVPETTFLGDYGDYSANKALVNKMSQIALQGRKYNVGLLVIAQRTANVSKTVLTQCNTIICFQAFDETSFNFLSNYVGKDLVKILPNLGQYHAVVTGKAVRSNMPMIIDLTREIKKDKKKKIKT